MSKIRRRLVVTGHNDKNESIVASEQLITGSEIPGMPGFETVVLWGSDTTQRFPDRGERPPIATYFPTREGYRFLEVYLPPHGIPRADHSTEGEEAAAMQKALPGLADTMTKGRPGMHRTKSVDMIIIMEGACVLQLDPGEVTLKAGDTLIESGTLHAWTNPFDEPCRFLAVVIGADNDLI